jgi:hypothetical protein
LVEVPNLSSSSVRDLDDHVPVVNEIKISVIWELRNNMEVSLNVKSELLVELSLGWFFLILVNIDDFPSLVDFAILILNNDVSIFNVNSSGDSNYLASFIYDKVILVSEKLPPS